jgi:polysaccharide biosynthesis protein PslG
VVAALLSSAKPSAAAAVPRHFFGVVPQLQPSSGELDRMRGTVGALRVPLYWSQVEPRAGAYDFSAFDQLVEAAARRRIAVLPFVFGSPSWLTRDQALPPLGSARARRAWMAFLRRLVSRYGPRGELWSGGGPALPIRRWQVWNEPNFRLFWQPRPSPVRYAELLTLAARAIRAEDPSARILAAGVAPVEGGMLPWEFVERFYRVPGVKRSFDLMAVHPYSSTWRGVAYQLRRIRRVMAVAGDAATPLRVTEVGVASGGHYPNAFDRGRRGQARFLRTAYGRLLRNRARWRIDGVDWFAWRDLPNHDNHCVFCQYAGLLDVAGRPKPAWAAYRTVAAGSAADPVR